MSVNYTLLASMNLFKKIFKFADANMFVFL